MGQRTFDFALGDEIYVGGKLAPKWFGRDGPMRADVRLPYDSALSGETVYERQIDEREHVSVDVRVKCVHSIELS